MTATASRAGRAGALDQGVRRWVSVVLVPSLFGSGRAANLWLVGAVAVLSVSFGVGTGRWRPPASPRTR